MEVLLKDIPSEVWWAIGITVFIFTVIYISENIESILLNFKPKIYYYACTHNEFRKLYAKRDKLHGVDHFYDKERIDRLLSNCSRFLMKDFLKKDYFDYTSKMYYAKDGLVVYPCYDQHKLRIFVPKGVSIEIYEKGDNEIIFDDVTQYKKHGLHEPKPLQKQDKKQIEIKKTHIQDEISYFEKKLSRKWGK